MFLKVSLSILRFEFKAVTFLYFYQTSKYILNNQDFYFEIKEKNSNFTNLNKSFMNLIRWNTRKFIFYVILYL